MAGVLNLKKGVAGLDDLVNRRYVALLALDFAGATNVTVSQTFVNTIGATPTVSWGSLGGGQNGLSIEFNQQLLYSTDSFAKITLTGNDAVAQRLFAAFQSIGSTNVIFRIKTNAGADITSALGITFGALIEIYRNPT